MVRLVARSCQLLAFIASPGLPALLYFRPLLSLPTKTEIPSSRPLVGKGAVVYDWGEWGQGRGKSRMFQGQRVLRYLELE